MTSTRPREGRGIRHAAGGEHDRLKRAVLQPVQCWDKKWTESKNGKQLQVFKWVKSDRQVDFDDEDDDEETEQAPVPRQVEEEVGTPAPPLPTLQDAEDTTALTPVQTGEEDEEDDADELSKNRVHPLSQSYPESDKRPNASSHSGAAAQLSKRDDRQAPQEDRDGDDDEDDTDSSRPLVFTPSLETPIETQANTPQDFESMSPAPVDVDELKEAQVEMVVKGLDEGQAEMEEEMEEVVVKEKEHSHPIVENTGDTQVMDMEHKKSSVEAVSAVDSSVAAPTDTKPGDDNSMDVDVPHHPSA
ncbi:hypothetical protein BC939DRAFT_449690 [Gamsiella multidivaricata]|uniref:uncharacterized protein n=1 Tax=Gamsiella multidivaricata TaxID=101098 RepID=UPI00221ED22B|nr:uncharacterized protein BC939DRAFT_449690 [Gamsiella multidivaricata]KAG0361946.1 hypothetical protein BGZ54_008847 [Gamsiella multidivaricata]KAI7824657.1 hypothetical protein BC939DRAFT_449690 [Gamsiella multidivaricata]